MKEFNCDLYKVKGTFIQDETEPMITGYYYQDEYGRHFIVDDEEFKHYETSPYSLCRNTGVKLKNSSYIPYEYDLLSYKEPFGSKNMIGYLQFNEQIKSWVLITSSITQQYRTLDKCCDLLYTGRNILIDDGDMEWFEEYSKKEYEKSTPIDNSYCPSSFKK